MKRAGAAIVLSALTAWAVPLEARDSLSDNEALYRELELFEQALAIIRSDYVKESEAQSLIYGALKGMTSTLDPYSQFLDPDSYNELKVDTEGAFGGLGIEITIKDDLLTIIAPIDDTPAYHAGLKSGDRIVKINGELTRGITLLDAVKQLRGAPATTVTLTIFREGEPELKEVAVERAIIMIESVREASVLEDGIAYIRLSDFREKTPEDLRAALARLKEEGMGSLILDLRNNPGGLLDVAVEVSELFLKRSQVIVTTKGRLRGQNQEFRARMEGPASDPPLVVLINEGSASASEIVAGAIQDHRRGIIMGTKSHGKASVQTIFPLRDGSALRLTTSTYLTPEGRLIHEQGILPDVEVPFVPVTLAKDAAPVPAPGAALFDRLESGRQDEPTPAEALAERKRTDTQLARAIDLLKGIKVWQEGAPPKAAARLQ
jgi:carboxyl-terminal processing protease